MSKLMSREKGGGTSQSSASPLGRQKNALQAGITGYLDTSELGGLSIKLLPRKYTAYPPLLILPVNFASTNPRWQTTYESLTQSEKQKLLASIAAAFKPQVITHIAINAAISPRCAVDGTENIVRSPSGITFLYGDLGLNSLIQPDANGAQPTQADFDAAFWTSTTQNGGIVQTWAPLWTMFSRGNITEKARILGEGNGMCGLTTEELEEDLHTVDVADFYVGIGYFAFSYLKRGVRTVFGWEINGWSVEGLRRGCKKNGWECIVARLNEDGQLEDACSDLIVQFLRRPQTGGNCVVFWGNNRSAVTVLGDLQRRCKEEGCSSLNVRHVNLGLLPTAESCWSDAICILQAEKGGWVHAHENVNIDEVELKRAAMLYSFSQLVQKARRPLWNLSCRHVEQVKTYAPGVMHCVFDIEITFVKLSTAAS